MTYVGSLSHMAEQSKLTSIHLCGLKLNESAISMPFIKYLNSGQIKADPVINRLVLALFYELLFEEPIIIFIVKRKN